MHRFLTLPVIVSISCKILVQSDTSGYILHDIFLFLPLGWLFIEYGLVFIDLLYFLLVLLLIDRILDMYAEDFVDKN